MSIREVLIETNAGTFSGAECSRVTGTHDTAAGTYRIYATATGHRFEGGSTGLTRRNAPGYARQPQSAHAALAALRAEAEHDRWEAEADDAEDDRGGAR